MTSGYIKPGSTKWRKLWKKLFWLGTRRESLSQLGPEHWVLSLEKDSYLGPLLHAGRNLWPCMPNKPYTPFFLLWTHAIFYFIFFCSHAISFLLLSFFLVIISWFFFVNVMILIFFFFFVTDHDFNFYTLKKEKASVYVGYLNPSVTC